MTNKEQIFQTGIKIRINNFLKYTDNDTDKNSSTMLYYISYVAILL